MQNQFNIDKSPPNGVSKISLNENVFVLVNKIGRKLEPQVVTDQMGEQTVELCDCVHDVDTYLNHVAGQFKNLKDVNEFIPCPKHEQTIGSIFGGSFDSKVFIKALVEEFMRNTKNVTSVNPGLELRHQSFLQIKEAFNSFLKPDTDYSKKYADTLGAEFGVYLYRYFLGALSTSLNNIVNVNKEFSKVFRKNYNDLSKQSEYDLFNGLYQYLVMDLYNYFVENSQIDKKNSPPMSDIKQSYSFNTKIFLKKALGVGEALPILKSLWSQFYKSKKKINDMTKLEDMATKEGNKTANNFKITGVDRRAYLTAIAQPMVYYMFLANSYYYLLEKPEVQSRPDFMDQNVINLTVPRSLLYYFKTEEEKKE